MTKLRVYWQRWWQEFLQPSMKCARVGHKSVKYPYVGFEDSSREFRAVADQVRGVLIICARCQAILARTVDERIALQGLGLPDDTMHELDVDGFVVVGQHKI